MEGNEWKIPFNIAVLLHLTIILGAVYGPGFLYNKPLHPDIYTVDLITAVEPISEPAQEVAKTTVEKTSETSKPKVSIASTPEVATPPQLETPIKPVSIKPLKRKKIKKIVQKPNQRKQLEKQHKKNLELAREAERRAAEAARLAASEAVNELKDMLRETNTLESATKPKTTAPASRVNRANTRNVIENQYFASVITRLEPHWKSPVHMTWSKDLVATVVIRIAKDGTIIDQFFEQKSGDRLFDQFVLKALRDGSSLPPIPAAMQKSNIELGLRFVPGSIN